MAVDQLTKALAITRLPEEVSYTLSGTAGLKRRMSYGGGFLLLPVRKALVLWLLAVGAVEAFLLLGPLPAMCVLGLGFAVGGATGNLADRLARGSVVDFLAVGRWPLFNLADVAMILGLALTSWSLL